MPDQLKIAAKSEASRTGRTEEFHDDLSSSSVEELERMQSEMEERIRQASSKYQKAYQAMLESDPEIARFNKEYSTALKSREELKATPSAKALSKWFVGVGGESPEVRERRWKLSISQAERASLLAIGALLNDPQKARETRTWLEKELQDIVRDFYGPAGEGRWSDCRTISTPRFEVLQQLLSGTDQRDVIAAFDEQQMAAFGGTELPAELKSVITSFVERSILVGLSYAPIERRLTPEIKSLQAQRDRLDIEYFQIKQRLSALRLASKFNLQPATSP